MRKILFMLFLSAFLLFCFSGCLNSEEVKENSNNSDDVLLTLKENTLTTKGATFILKNKSNKEYTYGPEFIIEKMVDEKWTEIKFNNQFSWNSVVYSLKANEEKEIDVDWSLLYNELTNGKYRLVKKIFKEGDNLDSEVRTTYLYSNFEISNGKQLIKLGYREVLGKDFEDEKLVNSKKTNLKFLKLPEMEEQRYNNNPEVKMLSDYIINTFNIKLDSNWKFFVHYFDENNEMGIVEFIYTVGEISTNRSIIFNITNGIVDTVYYKCLYDEINEKELLNRVQLFKSKYIQEAKQFKDDEKFESEETNYVYYINADTLVYNYALYFSYGPEKFINNDYGSVRIIDKNGNAIK